MQAGGSRHVAAFSCLLLTEKNREASPMWWWGGRNSPWIFHNAFLPVWFQAGKV